MKKFLAILIMVAMIISMLPMAFMAEEARPDSEIAVKLDGKWMTFDVDPILLNDRTMVPMRAIFEALGATVSWDDATQTATGEKDGKKVSVTIDSTIATVDGAEKTLDQSAVLKDGRTLVPLRFVSEAFGAEVGWDDPTQTVIITSKKEEPKEEPKEEEPVVEIEGASKLDYKYFVIDKFGNIGQGNAVMRFIAPKSAFPFELEENIMANVKVNMVITVLETGETYEVDTVLKGNEMREDGDTTLIVPATKTFPVGSYVKTHKIIMRLGYPGSEDGVDTSSIIEEPTFEYVTVKRTANQGTGANKTVRYILYPQDLAPIKVSADSLKGLKLQVIYTNKDTGKVDYKGFGEILSNEMRDDGLTTIVVASSEDIPFGSYFATHSFEIRIEKK